MSTIGSHYIVVEIIYSVAIVQHKEPNQRDLSQEMAFRLCGKLDYSSAQLKVVYSDKSISLHFIFEQVRHRY